MESFAVLEPTADGFRNYLQTEHRKTAEELLVERANMLTVTAPEMTVLVGGMRVLNANVGQSEHGVFTKRVGTLTNDFFLNLLDMNTEWQASSTSEDVFEGRVRGTGDLKWTGTRVDLVFVRTPSSEPSQKPTHVTTGSRRSWRRLRGCVGQGDES